MAVSNASAEQGLVQSPVEVLAIENFWLAIVKLLPKA